MKRFQFLLVLFLLFSISFVCSQEEEANPEQSTEQSFDEKDVKVLTDKNFADTIKASKYALVEFYAPWCGHCKKLAPNYAAAATILAKESKDIILAKVDATAETQTAQQFSIQGFPTLKWFIGGNVNQSVEYGGGRETDEIVKWVQKKTGPSVTEVSSQADLDKVEEGATVVVVAYLKNLKDQDYQTFDSVGQLFDDITFVATTSSSFAKSLGLKKQPSLVLVTKFDGEARTPVPYSDKFDKDSITKFVQSKEVPLVIPLSPQYYNKIFGSSIQYQLLLLGDKSQVLGDSKEAQSIKKVAGKFEGKVLFVGVDIKDPNMGQVLQFFGVQPQDEIVVVGFKSSDSSKFVSQNKFSEAQLESFAQKFAEDKLEKTLKSEEIPEKESDEDGVKIVVGKNFDQVVKDPSKDVLLEIYAPWCGHCKALAPTLAQLAKDLKSNSAVVISKMDGTENEIPELPVQGYPSIFLYPGEKDSKPIAFEGGDRSLEALKKFITKNSKQSKGAKTSDEL